MWALGVIFYELLTGETPWKAKNEKELVRKIEACKIEDLIGKLSLGEKSKEFLKRCLRVDKSMRWDTEDLQNFSFTTPKALPNILG